MGRHRHIDTAPADIFKINREEWHAVVKHLGLSPREAEIVKLILCDFGDKQIARHLAMSTSTVRTHLRHIFLRLNVCGRVGLVLHVFAVIHSAPDIIKNG